MHAVRGNLIALCIFAAAFVLHIVGGATDQGWLFKLAVVLTFASAVLFPVVAGAASGTIAGAEARWGVAVAILIGATLTASALWAVNDRTFAWWQPVGGAILVVIGILVARGEIPPPLWHRTIRR